MSLWFELKYGWRLLVKSWGYSLMCSCVAGLSVGLVVFAYSLVYSQLLKPVGFPGSDRWYSVQIAPRGGAVANAAVDAYTYQEMLKRNRSADYLGAFAGHTEAGTAIVLSEGQASRTLRAVTMSPRLLAATQAKMLLGRTFSDSDGQPGSASVAILSFDAWQNYFAGDPNIVGKTARMNSAPVQIIGVLPKEFFMFMDFEVWVPLPPNLPNLARPRDSMLVISPLIALGPNQNLKAITNEMQTAVDQVNREYPDLFDGRRHVEIFPANRMFTHYQTPIVLMVGMVAAALLLLGCVNISIVFLARLIERSRELALRSALGASRARIMRQCLLETVLIVAVGLAIAWVLASLGVHWAQGIGNFSAQTLAAGRFPNQLELHRADFIIAVISAAVVWVLSTLIPAWRILRHETASVLASSGKGTSLRAGSKGAGTLVGLQVVVSCLVLVTCGNMVLAVQTEVSRPTGLDTGNVILSTYPTILGARYSDASQRLRYWGDLKAAIETRIPQAKVAFTTNVPSTASRMAVQIETQGDTGHQGTLNLPVSTVSEDYFGLMGVNLRSGRVFSSTDNADSLKVAVVDERLANRYWPGQESIGKRLQLDPAGGGPWLTVVGVVSAIAGEPYSAAEGFVYQPMRQAMPDKFQVLVKPPSGVGDDRPQVLAAAFAVDRDLPLQNLQFLDVYLAALNLRWTSLVSTFLVIALITAVLAGSGLFGLISRSVVQRTQEVGVRRALGATAWQAHAIFMRQGALFLTIGFIGIGAGTAMLPVMSAVIPNILERVVAVTLSVFLLIAAVILAASYLPARRAAAVEPGTALRYE